MKLTEHTAPDQTATLSFEFDLQHAPEKVWRALTDPKLLAEWLLPTVGFDLAPGTSFAFETSPQPGWDGRVQCKLLASEAMKMLRYTWVVGAMDTVVEFTLTPTASGTHLALVHSGFTDTQKQNFAGARYGWKMMGNKLIDLLGKAL